MYRFEAAGGLRASVAFLAVELAVVAAADRPLPLLEALLAAAGERGFLFIALNMSHMPMTR